MKPEIDSSERLITIRGVEHHHRGVHVIQIEGVDEAVVWLPGEIPKDRFALCPIRTLETQFRDDPELLAVRGRVLSEFVVSQSPTQARLPDARISNQDDLRRRIPHRSKVRSRLVLIMEQDSPVNVPQADDRVRVSQGGKYRRLSPVESYRHR